MILLLLLLLLFNLLLLFFIDIIIIILFIVAILHPTSLIFPIVRLLCQFFSTQLMKNFVVIVSYVATQSHFIAHSTVSSSLRFSNICMHAPRAHFNRLIFSERLARACYSVTWIPVHSLSCDCASKMVGKELDGYNPFESSALYALIFFSRASKKFHLLQILSMTISGSFIQVNVPKQRRTFCKAKKCKKHTLHKVSQYKAGKASLYAQGES